MDQHRKPFTSADEDDHKMIDMAFNKKRADDRKQWLANFQVSKCILNIRKILHNNNTSVLDLQN